jgi:hypothetical protein
MSKTNNMNARSSYYRDNINVQQAMQLLNKAPYMKATNTASNNMRNTRYNNVPNKNALINHILTNFILLHEQSKRNLKSKLLKESNAELTRRLINSNNKLNSNSNSTNRLKTTQPRKSSRVVQPTRFLTYNRLGQPKYNVVRPKWNRVNMSKHVWAQTH